jgi:hypothetical protein
LASAQTTAPPASKPAAHDPNKVNGNISWQLSADDRSLSDVYNSIEWLFDHGAWDAQKK